LLEHKVHQAIDMLVLGGKHNRVYRLMDLPYRLLGRRHRELFHDTYTTFLIGYTRVHS
jgi:hypothetical protein